MFNFGINNKKVHFKMTGDTRRKSRGKGGFRLDFTNNNQAKSTERNVDSPLFGKMTVPDQKKFLGMSTKMKVKFYVMIIAIIGLALLIGDNLLATLAEINAASKDANDNSKKEIYDKLYENKRDNTFMYANMKTVENNTESPEGMQLPSYEPLDEEATDNPENSGESVPKNGNNSDKSGNPEANGLTENEAVPEVDDSDVPIDENGFKPQVTLPVGVYESIDYIADENPRLHAELLLKMNSLTDIQIKKLSNPFKQIEAVGEEIDAWYNTYKNSAKLKEYTGRVFEIEATVFKLEKKKVEYYNIKNDEIDNVTEVWQGILAFRYLESYPIGNKQDDKLQDEIGYVSFTTLKLPEWITPERVYDDKQLPLRGKFYGAFYGVPSVDPNVLEGFKHNPIAMPHIVLGTAEKKESVNPELDRDMLNRIFDGNSYTMQNVPMLALLNILYTFKYMPAKDKEALTKQVDRTIGYFDLLNNPPVMRKVMPVVYFKGELGKIVSETEPMKRYINIKPNPYNIRESRLGAIRLTNFEKPQNLIFDTMDVEILDPSTGKYVPEGTSISPETGKKIKKPYLTAGDTVEVYGYMLFNWNYLSQESELTTAPRIVAFKVRRIPTKQEDTSYLNWIFLAVVIIVIVIVIILVRKERKKATEFRSQFMRTHMKKPGVVDLKLNKSKAITPMKNDSETKDETSETSENQE